MQKNLMKKHLQYRTKNNEIIDYFLVKKNIKNLWMKINEKNEIIVSTPKNIKQTENDKFINNNIESFFSKLKDKKLKSSIDLDNKYFYLFGEKINFQIDKENEKMYFLNKSFKLHKKNEKEIIDNFRSKELKVYLLIAQLKLQKIMNIINHNIFVRNKHTTWATNHVTKLKIYYSISLSAFSKNIIDYVIIHELAHNKYPNHLKEFWNFVAKYEPEYKLKKERLKKHQYS